MEKTAIIAALKEHHQAFIQAIAAMSEAEFNHAQPGKWTAGQQLEHINKSLKPLNMVFRLPRFLLRLLFGKPNRTSRGYQEVVTRYQAKLAQGGNAPSQFVPKSVTFAQRENLIKNLRAIQEKLCQQVQDLDDATLDTFLIPHPLMGKITAREMLCFSIYHVQHHHLLMDKYLGR